MFFGVSKAGSPIWRYIKRSPFGSSSSFSNFLAFAMTEKASSVPSFWRRGVNFRMRGGVSYIGLRSKVMG